ncbi:MAG: tRNA-(ms[2]io[6]A)-hydroxylase [Planctomycetes bacterium]|nr:tRNA-(ms[2]io[6]A)-hydroxylase [Planctomycetota bacterium]
MDAGRRSFNLSYMLGLHSLTPKNWAEQALARPEHLLLDHYFCELKAAAMAQRTLKLYGKKYPVLKKLMIELAAEEMTHAEQCQRLLANHARVQPERGGNPYAQGLRKLAHASGGTGDFLDMLLLCSLIEARSAERFKLLADTAHGTELGRFYEDLFASEVNHYVLFVGLGADYFGEQRTLARLEELRAGEAALIRSLPGGPRMHSGPQV